MNWNELERMNFFLLGSGCKTFAKNLLGIGIQVGRECMMGLKFVGGWMDKCNEFYNNEFWSFDFGTIRTRNCKTNQDCNYGLVFSPSTFREIKDYKKPIKTGLNWSFETYIGCFYLKDLLFYLLQLHLFTFKLGSDISKSGKNGDAWVKFLRAGQHSHGSQGNTQPYQGLSSCKIHCLLFPIK